MDTNNVYKSMKLRNENYKIQAGAELCQAQLSLKLASHKVGSSQFLTANSFGA